MLLFTFVSHFNLSLFPKRSTSKEISSTQGSSAPKSCLCIFDSRYFVFLDSSLSFYSIQALGFQIFPLFSKHSTKMPIKRVAKCSKTFSKPFRLEEVVILLLTCLDLIKWFTKFNRVSLS